MMVKEKLVRITVYVTREQYEFLKELQRRKVSMSGFLRGLLFLHMYTKRGVSDTVVERRAVVVVSERRVPMYRIDNKLHRELMAELKKVLKGRRVD